MFGANLSNAMDKARQNLQHIPKKRENIQIARERAAANAEHRLQSLLITQREQIRKEKDQLMKMFELGINTLEETKAGRRSDDDDDGKATSGNSQANSDDSGESVGSRDSTDESDGESVGSFISDDEEAMAEDAQEFRSECCNPPAFAASYDTDLEAQIFGGDSDLEESSV
ncbi:hypothetical protein B0H10DRAFT_2215663 [Mycena sp. CBHHK59/15]|nr:hypothetical protein B0H10DRAFT_2215663 [Mycena sp. CBHHK59/15]